MAYRFPQSSESTSNHHDEDEGDSYGQMTESPINRPSDVIGTTYLPHTLFLCDFRHECIEECISVDHSEGGLDSKWRLKERMKTGCVAIALCLNIGVDPPDVIKISPCARMECWIDPFSMSTSKALDEIGKSLHSQYERWQPRARYKLQLDPTFDEVKKLCTSSRKSANTERVLFHYNGHGVPKPTMNGEIWVFNKSYTQYIPLPIRELDSWLGTPSIYVFDCSAAGVILNDFIEVWNSAGATGLAKDSILLAACGSHESLPQSTEFPADIFTSCLTTPLKMALQWLCSHSLLHNSIDYSLIDKIPGRQNDRKTLLGELNWIFTAITDTIAWTVLPHELFQRLFRQDLLVASLFRNFLLAQRIMRSANCSPVSYPPLPSTQQHHMWDAWDLAAEICLSKLPELIDNPTAEFQASPFFTEQLKAFELWLDIGSEHKKPPEQLPIILQVLLSQSHRYRALVLLGRFLDIGPRSVDLALSVGLFPYVLKLLQTMALELRQILVFIWAKILALDKSCQADLVKDGGHAYFIKFLDSVDSFPEQRAMAAFVLAVIADGHRPGQEACVRANLIHICFKQAQLASPCDAQTEPLLLQWLCLCLGKLWEDYRDVQIANLHDALTVLSPLLSEPQPEVRAAAVFALGTLINTGFDSVSAGKGEKNWKNSENTEAELDVVKCLLQVLEDGSPLVRAEVAVALSRFGIGHKKYMKSVAVACCKPRAASVMRRMPSLSIINSAVQVLQQESSLSSPIDTLLRSEIDGMARPRDARISTSGPAASTVLMLASPGSDGPSHLSEFDVLLNENSAANGVTHPRLSLSDSISSQCFLAMSVLSRDPSPIVADLGRRALATIGIEFTVLKGSNHNGGSVLRGGSSDQPTSLNVAGLSRSFSWLEMHSGHLSTTFRTPPISPPKDHYVTHFRRVHSFEYRSKQMASQKAGTPNPASKFSDCSETSESINLLPQSIIYRLSCGHFSRPLLTAFDPNEDVIVRREEREKIALDNISKCHHSSSYKFNNQIASWDTKFESGPIATILPPFAPIVIAADENERIRIWNYEDATQLNSFESHNSSGCGVSKLCLLNELDDSLLLVASGDGSIRVWKDFICMGKQKLVTAFSSIKTRKSGDQDLNAVVDWQQQSGYLYASGELPSILVWDLDKEQNIASIPFSSSGVVSAMSASRAHGGQLAAGFADGWVRIFDVRTTNMPVLETQVHSQRLGKVVGIGFHPRLYSNKIVSATQSGDIRILDIRKASEPLKFGAHKGSVTALSVHRHAPIIATGSPKQVVKVYGLDGEILGTAKYHPTLMAQRIGSVTCLSFHPHKPILAAGAEDSIVSIYADHT